MPRPVGFGTLLLLGAVFLGLAAIPGTAGAAADRPATDASAFPGMPGAPTMPEAPPVGPRPVDSGLADPQGIDATPQEAEPVLPVMDAGGAIDVTPQDADPVLPDFDAGGAIDVIPIPIIDEPTLFVISF